MSSQDRIRLTCALITAGVPPTHAPLAAEVVIREVYRIESMNRIESLVSQPRKNGEKWDAENIGAVSNYHKQLGWMESLLGSLSELGIRLTSEREAIKLEALPVNASAQPEPVA